MLNVNNMDNNSNSFLHQNYCPYEVLTAKNIVEKSKKISRKRGNVEISDLVSEATTNDTSSSSSNKESFSRSGKWSNEEESYAKELISRFQAGTLSDCAPGCSLRIYLATKLKCAPMRISKKFAGLCIGKETYKSQQNELNCVDDIELKTLENMFILSAAASQGSNNHRRSSSPNSLDESNHSSSLISTPIVKKDNNRSTICDSIAIESEWISTDNEINYNNYFSSITMGENSFEVNNTFVDDKNFKNNDELKKDISTFFFGNNDENCHIDSYKQEYQLVVKDGEI